MVEKNECIPEIWGGIECTINRVGNNYFDQVQFANLYQHPHAQLIAGLGIRKIRFPILWERHVQRLEDKIDWDWTSQQLEFLRKNKVEVIAGLVHHGSGPSFTNLLDPAFPELLAGYAAKVAAEFPWIKYYTPVNEPLTTARFSSLYGFWYPHKRNEKSFFLSLLYQLKGIVLSMREIRKINPEAQLVQTEDLGKTYSTRKLKYQADFENHRRWLTYDILCGKFNNEHPLWKFYSSFRIPKDLLDFFIQDPCVPEIFGFNHYVTSERYIDEKLEAYPSHTWGGNGRHRYADIEAVRIPIAEETGIKRLLNEAWERYRQPIAITEVHLHCHREEQIRWFKYVHEACNELAKKGMDIRGVTAWALFGSYGWNKLLMEGKGDYEPGVFDLRGGSPRPTALANYIRSISSLSPVKYHFENIEGWWLRDCRFIYDMKSVTDPKITSNGRQKPILIIGKRGTLGRAFARICEARAIHYIVAGREECDIADPESVANAISYYKPWAVINAAGYVRVDDAQWEQEQCYRENHHGPVHLAKACKKYGIKLVSFSTDLVFDGLKNEPYVESDSTNPLNIYGKSKRQAELQLNRLYPSSLIIRTSSFFGPWDEHNFVHAAENSLSNATPFRAANDIYVSPTYVPDLVHATLDLVIDDESGIWHLTNKGVISWADLAFETASRKKLNRKLIHAVSAEELNYAAPRPRYSALSSEKATLLPCLENALDRYFAEKNVFYSLMD